MCVYNTYKYLKCKDILVHEYTYGYTIRNMTYIEEKMKTQCYSGLYVELTSFPKYEAFHSSYIRCIMVVQCTMYTHIWQHGHPILHTLRQGKGGNVKNEFLIPLVKIIFYFGHTNSKV